MASIPHASGKDATINLFINGSAVATLDIKSWSCKRNTTKIDDGVQGENRDRLDAITNSFSIDLEGFNQTMTKLQALLTDLANDDAQVQPTDKQVSFVIKPRDGTKVGFLAKGCCLDDWEIGAQGRTDRIMSKIPLRAQYFDVAPI